jgi:hypothetical protein
VAVLLISIPTVLAVYYQLPYTYLGSFSGKVPSAVLSDMIYDYDWKKADAYVYADFGKLNDSIYGDVYGNVYGYISADSERLKIKASYTKVYDGNPYNILYEDMYMAYPLRGYIYYKGLGDTIYPETTIAPTAVGKYLVTAITFDMSSYYSDFYQRTAVMSITPQNAPQTELSGTLFKGTWPLVPGTYNVLLDGIGIPNKAKVYAMVEPDYYTPVPTPTSITINNYEYTKVSGVSNLTAGTWTTITVAGYNYVILPPKPFELSDAYYLGEWPLTAETYYEPALDTYNIPEGSKIYSLVDTVTYEPIADPITIPGYTKVNNMNDPAPDKWYLLVGSSGFNYIIILPYVGVPAIDENNPVPLGDVNYDSKITIKDVELVYRHYRNKLVLAEFYLQLADVNKDKKIDLIDVTLIYQRYRGKIDTFPTAP